MARSKVKTNAARMLDRMEIAYEVRTYAVDEEDLSAAQVAAQIGMPSERVFKTLVARTDRRDVVLGCVPGDAELNPKALGAAAGAKRADLVPVKDVLGLTGYVRGGVSPIGTRKAFPVFLDVSAEQWDAISISGGQRGVQIVLAPDDLVRAVQATVCVIRKT